MASSNADGTAKKQKIDSNISSISTKASTGKTGVDLRWWPRHEFVKLSQEQKDELTTWQASNEGKAFIKKTRKDASKKRKAGNVNDTSPSKKTTSWKSKFKKSIKTPSGLADVMALLVEEEKSNQALVAAIQDQHNQTDLILRYQSQIH